MHLGSSLFQGMVDRQFEAYRVRLFRLFCHQIMEQKKKIGVKSYNMLFCIKNVTLLMNIRFSFMTEFIA